MRRKVFLDANIFFDCLESQDFKNVINHAIHRDCQIFTSLTVIGEVILIMKREQKSDEDLVAFSSLFDEWEITILIPTDEVAFICYEFSKDDTDGRIIGEKTDRTHLAYAIAYECDFFVTSDDALMRYRIPMNLKESDFNKPHTLTLDRFKEIVLNKQRFS